MTHDDIIRIAIDAGFEEGWVEVCNVIPEMEKFAAIVAEEEREACAKVCGEMPSNDPEGPWFNDDMTLAAIACAKAIRMRSN